MQHPNGAKRWFVAPPNSMPPFDPDTSSFKWFHQKHDVKNESILQCVQGAGEALWL